MKKIYCNSCGTVIAKSSITYCEQCGVPLHAECANHCMECGKALCDTCSLENNFKCESCYKPSNMFPVIRRSHLEQYQSCPYSVYLQLVTGITPPMGKAAQLGVIVHELIDEKHQYETVFSELEKRVADFNNQVEEKDKEYSYITEDLIEVGETCLDNYYKIKHYFPEESYSEYNIKFDVDPELPIISCTLDRIIEKDGRLEVHDWKTGRPLSGQKLISDLQPPLYLYAVYKKMGRMPDSFTLHYLRTGKDIVYQKVDDNTYQVTTKRSTYTLKIDEALKRTKDILRGIVDNKFNMPPEGSDWRCKRFCWFGMSGTCQGSQDEQWKALNRMYG